jgi:hypothetical protein
LARLLRPVPYHPDFGKEIAPGVRQVDLGAVASTLPGYKTVTMRDLVFQPGANTFDPMAQNDMIGYVTDGLIRVRLNDRLTSRTKPNLCLSCGSSSRIH